MQKQLPQLKFQNIQTIYHLERYNHLSDYDPHERVRNLKYELLPYFQLTNFHKQNICRFYSLSSNL